MKTCHLRPISDLSFVAKDIPTRGPTINPQQWESLCLDMDFYLVCNEVNMRKFTTLHLIPIFLGGRDELSLSRGTPRDVKE